jgi:DMSO/TMAO reductase YedYZ molybdopterin-dependent catalytic subunit
MQTKQLSLIFLLCGLVCALFANPTGITAYAATNDLGEVEIRQYEGQNLSSVIDSFRENSIKGPQYIDNETYRLIITGIVNKTMNYTYDEVIGNHQSFKKVITLYCVEGWKTTILWEGIMLKDLLAEALVKPETTTVIFYAEDGYSTSFPLEYVIDNNIMIAYKMNNMTLPPERGYPFQLVAESKWGYKWIKWITTIELSDNADYKGYWESRGFSNIANLGSPFYDDYGTDYGNFIDFGDIPEFPTTAILPIVLVVSVATILFRKRVLKDSKQQNENTVNRQYIMLF